LNDIVKKLFVLRRERLLLLLMLVQCLLFPHTVKADVYAVGRASVGTTSVQTTSYFRRAKFEASRVADTYRTSSTNVARSNYNSNAFLMKKVSGGQVHSVGSESGTEDFTSSNVRYSKNNNGLTYATVKTTLPNTMLAKNISLANRDADFIDDNSDNAGPRRIGGGGGDGFLPKPTPIGGSVWLFLLFATGYLTLKLTINYRRKIAGKI